VINDCCSLQVQAGRTPTVEVLKLLEAFTNEENYTVWSAINNCLSKLSSLLSCTDYEDLFKAYGRRLMQEVYSRVGWDPRDNESEYVDMPCYKGCIELSMIGPCAGEPVCLMSVSVFLAITTTRLALRDPSTFLSNGYGSIFEHYYFQNYWSVDEVQKLTNHKISVTIG
jgi:hypothetical protein